MFAVETGADAVDRGQGRGLDQRIEPQSQVARVASLLLRALLVALHLGGSQQGRAGGASFAFVPEADHLGWEEIGIARGTGHLLELEPFTFRSLPLVSSPFVSLPFVHRGAALRPLGSVP